MSRPSHHSDVSRRRFLQTGTAALTGLGLSGLLHHHGVAAEDRPLKVAAVITEFTHRSHAHVILENFLEPYLFNGENTVSGMDVVSLYVDQFPDGDMARDVAKQYGMNIYPTIAGALCDGGDRLAVDAVLSIGEHGNYPHNEKGQHMYPRKGRTAAPCRCSTTSIYPIAGTSRKRCTTRPRAWTSP